MKAYIISLSEIESSISTATNVHTKLTEYGFDAVLFEGTYGPAALEQYEKEGRTVHPFGIKTEPLSSEDNIKIKKSIAKIDTKNQYLIEGVKRSPVDENAMWRVTRPGVLGCFYSHYRLWEECVKLNETIFIFEDDVIFIRPYTPVEFDEVLVVALGKDLYRTKFKSVYETPEYTTPIALDFHRTSMPGAVGYGITPTAAKKLVNTYKKTVLPADNAINQFEVNIKIHSHLIGRAALEDDGKISLTSAGAWRL